MGKMGTIDFLISITTEQLIDKLSRAYEMEEAMSSRLVDLCRMEEPIDGLAEETQADILKILNKIKEDTLRHKKNIMDILHELSRRKN